MKKMKNYKALIFLGITGLAVTVPTTSSTIDKTGVVVGAILGSVITACAPTVYKAAQEVLANAWEKTKEAAVVCAYYTKYVSAVAGGSLCLVGSTAKTRIAGITLLGLALLADRYGRLTAPRPQQPAVQRGLAVQPVGTGMNYLGLNIFNNNR